MSKLKSTSFLIEFGKNLKRIRTRKKMSYRTLAQYCNVDFSDISKIEKGGVNIQIETASELAKGLDVHVKELFDFDYDFGE